MIHRPAIAALLALLLPALASAQAPDADRTTLEIEAGGQAVITEGDREDRAAARATLDLPLPIDGFRLAVRIEASGTQAGGDLPFDPYSPRTFRAVEGIMEARRQWATGLAVGVAGGYTWSIEGKDGPRDPHLWTGVATVRFALPGGGWARLGGGWHGPAGGAAGVAALSYAQGRGRLLVDFARPFKVDASGAPRAGVLRVLVSVPLKSWSW